MLERNEPIMDYSELTKQAVLKLKEVLQKAKLRSNEKTKRKETEYDSNIIIDYLINEMEHDRTAIYHDEGSGDVDVLENYYKVVFKIGNEEMTMYFIDNEHKFYAPEESSMEDFLIKDNNGTKIYLDCDMFNALDEFNSVVFDERYKKLTKILENLDSQGKINLWSNHYKELYS